jgi:hypothetical protein
MNKKTSLIVFLVSAASTAALTVPSSAMALFTRNVHATACVPTRGATGIGMDLGYLQNTGTTGGDVYCAYPDDSSLPVTKITLVKVFVSDGSTTDLVSARSCYLTPGTGLVGCSFGSSTSNAFTGVITLSLVPPPSAVGDLSFLRVHLPANGASVSRLEGYFVTE